MDSVHTSDRQHRAILQAIARRAMLDRGLLPDFSAAALVELEKVRAPATSAGEPARDLTGLPWASIDNDDSLDLDQLTAAIAAPGENVRILVAIADVDAFVRNGSAIDEHARCNTTSVYTAASIFHMLPEKLSTDLTSLNPHEERLSIVVEMVIDADGSVQSSDIYRALVRSHARLAYGVVGAWLEGRGTVPEAITALEGLAENLRLQDRAAQSMKNLRHANGALTLETIEARPVFEGDTIRDLRAEEPNRANDLIKNLMITTNVVTARYLSSKGLPSIRRVVRAPERWDRIVAIAAEHQFALPDRPDSAALQEFLTKEQAADQLRFPDLSLAVIKLLGSGEYTAELPGDAAPGHFGLAVKDYAHSTAPNRRYTDLITQRLLKAAIDGKPSPYTGDELAVLATHCSRAENAVNKVERQVGKSAAALLLRSRIGEQFDALVTGAAAKGTWVRLLEMPVEGKLALGFEGLDVGHRIRVQLISVDIEQGFIDFKRVGRSRSQ
jgi:VacB/RNase II family 3'-5' exoribonuclease